MENVPPLNASPRRRRRILAAALVPLLAALAVAWLEAGPWLVVYNDTAAPLGEIQLRCGSAQWSVRDLGPRESRRLRLPRSDDAEVVVTVADWAPDAPHTVACDWRTDEALTLRLQSSRTVLATGGGGLLGALLRW